MQIKMIPAFIVIVTCLFSSFPLVRMTRVPASLYEMCAYSHRFGFKIQFDSKMNCYFVWMEHGFSSITMTMGTMMTITWWICRCFIFVISFLSPLVAISFWHSLFLPIRPHLAWYAGVKQILWTLSMPCSDQLWWIWFESVASIIEKNAYLLSCHLTKMFQFRLAFFFASSFFCLFCMWKNVRDRHFNRYTYMHAFMHMNIFSTLKCLPGFG